MRHAHPASAAAGHGLDHHRITDVFGDGQGVLFLFHDAVRTGRGGHAGLFGQRPADRLVGQRLHRARTGADETDVATLANLGEMRVLRKKTVAGMNRVHVRDFRRADDAVNAQITFRRRRFADANGFVGQLHVHGIGIRLRINGHGADVQFLAGADDPNGDFAAIGDQNFFKHGLSVKANRINECFRRRSQAGRTLNNGWPNSTGLAFSTRTCVMTPLTSALISFITFIASMMQTTVSGLTSVPIST